MAALYEKFETDTAEAESLQQRIDTINDDLRKYKDLRKVRKMGSSDGPEVVNGHCPTCHQELADSLLDTGNKAVPMTVDQNVSFYEEQISSSRQSIPTPSTPSRLRKRISARNAGK